MGTRTTSITAPATYELPPDAVGEIIVNAIAYRDYHSHASVEVCLFADRLEIWNPGTLTLDDLRHDHPLVTNNLLIAESLYLTGHIEKDGSGTQRMIELCREAGLPAPDFDLRQDSFVLTLWRDWLTSEALAGLNLNERQRAAIVHIKQHGRMTNTEFQATCSVAKRTASLDPDGLVSVGLLEKIGNTGRGAGRNCRAPSDP